MISLGETSQQSTQMGKVQGGRLGHLMQEHKHVIINEGRDKIIQDFIFCLTFQLLFSIISWILMATTSCFREDCSTNVN